MHSALRAQVDQAFLPGVSTVLLRGREEVDRFVYGHADLEAGTALRDDHLFRVFSNTKLPTSCAIMLLVEDGQLRLDDPVAHYLPAFSQPKVLRPGATRIDEVEDARQPITVAHLMTHTAGLSYGLFDPGTLSHAAYKEAGLQDPALSPAEFVQALAKLPLNFHPGEQWEYSLATDVLGHLIEVVSGQSLGDFFRQRIFQPLGMVDTDFWVPEAKRDRLTALYGGMDFMNPLLPGLRRMDNAPYPGAYTHPRWRQSGGGGLISTLNDTVALVRSLIPGGPTLLQPESLALMQRNQLRPGRHVVFPNMPSNPGQGFGLGSAVLQHPSPFDPPNAADEWSWGGLAGTMWWINPRLNIAGVLMTQRFFGFGNPYAFQFRNLAYQGLNH